MQELLGLTPTAFRPSIPNLVYQYCVYTNYHSDRLASLNPEIDAEDWRVAAAQRDEHRLGPSSLERRCCHEDERPLCASSAVDLSPNARAARAMEMMTASGRTDFSSSPAGLQAAASGDDRSPQARDTLDESAAGGAGEGAGPPPSSSASDGGGSDGSGAAGAEAAAVVSFSPAAPAAQKVQKLGALCTRVSSLKRSLESMLSAVQQALVRNDGRASSSGSWTRAESAVKTVADVASRLEDSVACEDWDEEVVGDVLCATRAVAELARTAVGSFSSTDQQDKEAFYRTWSASGRQCSADLYRLHGALLNQRKTIKRTAAL